MFTELKNTNTSTGVLVSDESDTAASASKSNKSQISIYNHDSNLKITSYILNGSNYSEWQRSVQLVIKGKGKFGYLSGTTAEPTTNDPNYENWEAENAMVMEWLINSMEPEINKKYMFFHTAKEIWDGTQKMYSDRGNTSQMFETRLKLKDLRQGNLSVTSYFSKLQDLWREIDLYLGSAPLCANCTNIQTTQKETERVYEFLTGLNNVFDDTRASIIRTKPFPNSEEAFSEIRREETRRQVMLSTITNRGIESSALIANEHGNFFENLPQIQNHHRQEYNPTGNHGTHFQNHIPNHNQNQFIQNNGPSMALASNRTRTIGDHRGGRKPDRPWCDHCHRHGHTKGVCWEIHGKPTSWGPKKSERRVYQGDSRGGAGGNGGSGNGLNQGNHASFQPAETSSQTNKEQMEHFYALLQQSQAASNAASNAASPSCSVARAGNPSSPLVSWIIDSGATDHMTSHKFLFHDLINVSSQKTPI